MADIQLMQCKNQQKTSSYRRNSVPYKEIWIKESNDDVALSCQRMLAFLFTSINRSDFAAALDKAFDMICHSKRF